MACEVLLVCGPAGSGKTADLLQGYSQQLQNQGSAGQLLWLAPTSRGVDSVRERIVSSTDGCLSPGVFTFHHFAQQVIHASSAPVRPLSGHLKRTLVRQIVRDADRNDQLAYFKNLANSAGLVDLLCDTFQELKRLEIWPEDFHSQIAKYGTPKDREIGILYTAYQTILKEYGLYDEQGWFWTARELLDRGESTAFTEVRDVVVDGFTDFTRTQHEILELLARRVERLSISLPLEEGGQREDLFAKAHHTLTQLHRRHPNSKMRWIPRTTNQSFVSIDHIEKYIFGNSLDEQPKPSAEKINILAAAGSVDEIDTIARNIKRLLLCGDEGTEVHPEQVVVAFRSLNDSAALIRERFTIYGIPFSLEHQGRLIESPAVKFLINLIRLDVENWPYRLLLKVLDSNFLRLLWQEASDEVFFEADYLVRGLQVAKGRKDLLRRVEQLAKAADPESGELDSADLVKHDRGMLRIRAAKLVLPLLKKLADVFDNLPQRAGLSEWIEKMAELCSLFFAETESDVQGESNRHDRVNIRNLLATLRQPETLRTWLGQEAQILGREELLELLQDIAMHELVPLEQKEIGRVRILSAAGVRALRVDYLFLAGLNERGFPSPEREDKLYRDSDLDRFSSRPGLDLIPRTDRTHEEMLLFYEVVTRATRRLFLCYSKYDDSATELPPSPFLQEIIRLFQWPSIGEQESIPLGGITQEPMCPEEYRRSAVAKSLEGDGLLLQNYMASKPYEAASVCLASGITAICDRTNREHFSPYEGMFVSENARVELANLFSPSRAWSPSHLEQYASCPFQFLQQQVLRLRVPQELKLEEDRLSRGTILHDLLARVHRKARDTFGHSTSWDKVSWEWFEPVFISSLDNVIDSCRRESPIDEAFLMVDRIHMLRLAKTYFDQQLAYSASNAESSLSLLPMYFEYAFGREPHGGNVDSLSTSQPLQLKRENDVVLIAGRIDRIDTGSKDEHPVFSVVDYKSGNSQISASEGMDQGTSLQLPLYTMAVEQLLFGGSESRPIQAGYWHVKLKGFSGKSVIQIPLEDDDTKEEPPSSGSWREMETRVMETVFSLIDSIRRGEFPVISMDEHCTSYCPFRTVCRVNQVRSFGKTWIPRQVSST